MEEGVVGRQSEGSSDGGPAGSRNRGVLESPAKVPSQMPQSVDAVEEEGHRNGKFGSGLGPHRPGGDRGDKRLALEVPPERGRRDVCDSKDVKTSAEDDGRETVETGGVPGDLGLVDGKVRGDRTLEALLGKDCLARLLANSVCQSNAMSASRVRTLGRWGEQLVMVSRATYRRWTMRPAGWTMKLGAAARRRPSWNTRWEAIIRAATANWYRGERVVVGGGDVVALSRSRSPASEPLPKHPITALRLVNAWMAPENYSHARFFFFSLGTSISPPRPSGMRSRSDSPSAGVMSVVTGYEGSAKNCP